LLLFKIMLVLAVPLVCILLLQPYCPFNVMKTTLLRSLLAVGLALGAMSARAATTAGEATVLQIDGNATATFPGESTARPLSVGTKLPQGAIITTGAETTLHIQPFSGAVTTINQNTTVSLEKLSLDTASNGTVRKQTALLNLKSGNLVSTIDPSKKDINDYGVSTPKGVAAARGTQLTTNISEVGAVTVTANADNVVFTTPGGTVTIRVGQVSYVPAGSPAGFTPMPVPLSTLANSNSEIAVAAKAAVAAGVTALTQVLKANANSGISAADTASLASQIISASNIVNPSGAAANTASVVTAMAANTVTAGSADAIAKVVQEAVRAAPTQAATIATQVSTAVNNTGAANAVTTIQTVVQATLQVAPAGAAGDIAKAIVDAVPALRVSVAAAVLNTGNANQASDVINKLGITDAEKTIINNTPTPPPPAPPAQQPPPTFPDQPSVKPPTENTSVTT
jgi:hypothetical protein